MPNFNWIKDYVGSLYVVPYGRYRGDCPICNRINTFSVTDTGFERLWNCFHADCNTGGSTGVQLTKENSKVAFKEQIEKEEKKETSEFVLPDTFVSLSRSINAENYVKEVNSYDAYLSGLADIRYDYQQDRVVFLVKSLSNGRVVDATGRSLNNNRKPKWRRYGNNKRPFICGRSDTALLVEDCPSACSVAHISTGIALMGTSLLDEHIEIIKNFKKVYVALDKDATSKAISLIRKLRNYVPTKLIVLNKDLKDMNRGERDEFIKRYIN
jgi:DNA primase